MSEYNITETESFNKTIAEGNNITLPSGRITLKTTEKRNAHLLTTKGVCVKNER